MRPRRLHVGFGPDRADRGGAVTGKDVAAVDVADALHSAGRMRREVDEQIRHLRDEIGDIRVERKGPADVANPSDLHVLILQRPAQHVLHRGVQVFAARSLTSEVQAAAVVDVIDERGLLCLGYPGVRADVPDGVIAADVRR